MLLKISTNEETKNFDVEPNESSIWKTIGECLLEVSIPNDVLVTCELGDAALYVKGRGTYIKNGEVKPSMYVEEKYNHIRVAESEYKECFLTCINPESNNYKFYHMKPSVDGINVTYGRLGSEKGEMFGPRDVKTPYEPHLYWIRYYEKISKGYIDDSKNRLKSNDIKTSKKSAKSGNAVTIPEYSRKLYQVLKSCARQCVLTHCVSDNVTYRQVKRSKAVFKELSQRKTVNGFNKKLLELMALCPRKARYINELLAKSTSDFSKIINREETLIDAMEVLVSDDDRVNGDSFEGNNIEVYIATDKQSEQVMEHLTPDLQKKVKTIYRVINKKSQKNFDKYLKNNNIKKVKQFWHGSKNENWLSIIMNGLQLYPNAEITGKMFGDGIYFAPSCEKSWKYTSYRGSYWAKGTSDFAYMGLYATAYGVPEDTYSAHKYSKSELDSKNKNCVHAHKGQALYNDEVIYYDENAMTLNYIVEFN